MPCRMISLIWIVTRHHVSEEIITFNLTHLGHSASDRVLRVAGDERMERFVFAGHRLAVFAANFAFFDRAFAANDNLGVCLKENAF